MAELRYVDWDGLVYYDGKVKQYIDDKIEDCLKVGGIVTGETLPSPSFRNLNYIYKITDEFTADDNFEASLRGYIYDPGTWVQVTDINHVYLYTIFMEANASASDYEKLEEAIKAIQAEAIRLDTELNETSRRVASLDQSMGETAVKVSELESSLATLNDKVDSKADTATVQAHYETSELKFNNLTSQVSANTSSISTLSASVLSSQATLSNLDTRLDSIEPEVEKIKGFENEINSLDDRIETIDDSVTTLINSSSTILTKVDTLEDKVSDNETAIETLTTSTNELDERVEALESRPESDLSQFALKSEIPEVPTKVSAFDNDAGYLTEHQSLEGYAKVTEIPDVSNYVTMSQVEDQGYLKEIPSEYIKDSDLDQKGYLTSEDLADKADKEHTHNINSIEGYTPTDLSGYATEEFVTKKIAEAELADQDVDLSAYYTKSEVDALIPDVSNFITEVPSEYVTNEELEGKGYLTEHQDLSEYAKKSDIPDYKEPDLSGYALREEVPTKVSELENDKGYLTSIPDTYATKEDISGFTTLEEVESQGYLKEHQDLSNYALKSEIPSIEGLAQTSYVDDKIDALNIPTVPTNVSEFTNDANYITESALVGYVKEDTLNTTISNYYTKEEIVEQIPTATSHLSNDSGFVTSKDVEDLIANQPVGTDEETVKQIIESYSYVDTSTMSSTLETQKEEILQEVTDKNYLVLSDLDGYAKSSDLPTVPSDLGSFTNDVGYITNDALTGYVKEEALNNYYNKSEVEALIPDTSEFIKEIPTEYITENELADATKHFITDVSNKADVDHKHTLADITDYEAPVIPDVSEFVTSDEVESAIENKQDKLVSGTNIATINGKSLLDGGNIEISGGTISSPDDIILNFVDPTVNTIGGIAAGTVITNWSLTKLIQTMLFGQSSTPDEPEYETPTDKIIAEEIPMYNMDANGNLIEVPFVLRTLDEAAAAEGPADLDGTEDGFYQITDSNGEVIESGYQTTSCTGAESPYILALPKDISITDGKVEYWDLLNNTWYSDPDYKFSTDLSMLVDYEIMSQEDVDQLVAQYDAIGYNVWIQNEPEEPPTGKVFRFIIE